MCPSAPRVCSEPGGQKPVLSLSLDRIIHLVHTLLFLWFVLCFLPLPVLWGSAWFYPYPPGLLHRLWGNHMIAPVPVKQPWRIWVKCITWIHQEQSYNYIEIKPNKSHNIPVPHPTMHLFVTEICAHFWYKMAHCGILVWYIVGFTWISCQLCPGGVDPLGMYYAIFHYVQRSQGWFYWGKYVTYQISQLSLCSLSTL